MKTKRTKRLRIAASLILAAVMIISCIGVYAPGVAKADETTLDQTNRTGTITIAQGDTAVSIEGHTYSAYRVFDLIQGSSEAFDYRVIGNFKKFFVDKINARNSNTVLTEDTITNTDIRKYMTDVVGTKNDADTVQKFAHDLYDYIANGTPTAGAYVSGRSSGDSADKFAPDATATVAAGGTSATFTTGSSTALPIGYYIIIDTSPDVAASTTNTATNQLASAIIIDTTAWQSVDSSGNYNLTVTTKGSVPTCDKEITYVENKLTNKSVYPSGTTDPTNATTDDSVTADAATGSIGDTVHFKVTSKTPDLTGYTEYEMLMTDTLDQGLTYNNDMVVTISWTNSESVAQTLTYYQKTTTGTGTMNATVTGPTEGTSKQTQFTVELGGNANGSSNDSNAKQFYTLLKNNSVPSGSTITYEYSATINNKAAIGAAGNTNAAKITYSNNPNITSSTGNTPEDTVEVYTFALDLTKVAADKEGNVTATNLSGAEFELYTSDQVEKSSTTKRLDVKTGESPITFITANTDENAANIPISVQACVGTVDSSNETINVLKTDANGKILVNGLGAGTYYLKEIKAPTGYNMLEDLIEITFDPEYDSSNKTSLVSTETEIKGSSNTSTGRYTGGLKVESDDAYDLYKSDSSLLGLKTTITNSTGTELPSTGGAGTRAIYIIGGLLIAIAVISMTVRKLADRKH